MPDASPHSLLDRADHNRGALATLAVPTAVVAGVVVALVVGLLTLWWVGLLAGLACVGAMVALLPRSAATSIGKVLGARVAQEAEFPRYHNLVDGLAMGSGADTPALFVLDDPALNVAVYGPPDAGVIVATSGLLEQLDRVELEGVLAEALVRLRSHDAELAAQASGLVCGPLVRNGPRRSGRPMGYVAFGAERRARRLRRVLGDQRSFLADLAAVDMTRYPPGLGSALEKMERAGTGVASATWGTAHLWMADPLLEPADSDPTSVKLNALFGVDAPLDQRASLMAEL